jgi:hypothetical protein
MDRLAGALDGPRRCVDRQVVDLQHGVLHLMPAADEGTQAREQLLQFERLGQVVIGAGIESFHLVFKRPTGGEDNHVCFHPRAAPPLEQR